MAGFVFCRIDITGIAEAYILHDTWKRNVTHLNRQMNMIGHLAKGMNTVVISFYPLLQPEDKSDYGQHQRKIYPGRHYLAPWHDKKRRDNGCGVYVPWWYYMKEMSSLTHPPSFIYYTFFPSQFSWPKRWSQIDAVSRSARSSVIPFY